MVVWHPTHTPLNGELSELQKVIIQNVNSVKYNILTNIIVRGHKRYPYYVSQYYTSVQSCIKKCATAKRAFITFGVFLKRTAYTTVTSENTTDGNIRLQC